MINSIDITNRTEEENHNKEYKDERKVNKLKIDQIVTTVKSNIAFIDYYTLYVDKNNKLKYNSKCLCPMHEENEPSFRHFPDTDTFSCFGKCHVAGNVIKFHEVYLKYLLKTGQITKLKSISNIDIKNITYYTALEDLIKIFHLNTPKVFLEEEKPKKATMEELLGYFNAPKTVSKLEEVELSYKTLNSQLTTLLDSLRIKHKENHPKYLIEYISILTSGEIEETLLGKLQEFKETLKVELSR